NITGWLKIGSGIRVAAHEADCKMIGNPVVDAYDKAACRKIITLGLAVIVNGYPVAPTVSPDAPAVLRRGGRGYRWFRGYFFCCCGACNRRWHRGKIRDKTCRASLDLVETLIEFESLRIGLRKANLVNCR